VTEALGRIVGAPDDRVLSAAGAARFLGIGATAFARLCDQVPIPEAADIPPWLANPHGRYYRVRDLERVLDRCRPNAGSPRRPPAVAPEQYTEVSISVGRLRALFREFVLEIKRRPEAELSPREAADEIGCSERYVAELARSGALLESLTPSAAPRNPTARRFRPEDVARLAARTRSRRGSDSVQ